MNEDEQQAQVYQPDGTRFGYAAGAFLGDAAATVGAVAGAKAGKNHYERTADLGESAWLGAIAGRRWFVWTIGWVVWAVQILITFCISMTLNVQRHDARRSGTPYMGDDALLSAGKLTTPIMFVVMLVLYKRNIDFSLFKRRAIYYVIAPVAALLNWCPNWLLYAGFAILPITFQHVL